VETGSDKEGPRTHSGINDFEIEDLLGTLILHQRRKCALDEEVYQRLRCVIAPTGLTACAMSEVELARCYGALRLVVTSLACRDNHTSAFVLDLDHGFTGDARLKFE